MCFERRKIIQIIYVSWQIQTTSLNIIKYFEMNKEHIWLQSQYHNMLTCDELYIVSNAHDPICDFDCLSLLVY